MQDALGGRAIEAALRLLANNPAGLFDCEADPCLPGAMSVSVRSRHFGHGLTTSGLPVTPDISLHRAK